MFFYRNGKFKYKKSNFFERSSSIPSCFKNRNVRIHKGNSSRRLFINKYVIGKKFGEFAFTRKPFHFPLRKKKGKLLRR